MSINGITFDERYQKSIVHGAFNQAILSDGVLNGCAISNNTTSMTIGIGTMVIGGRLIYFQAAEQTSIVSPTGNYVRFYFKIDLTQTPDSTTFSQGTIEYDYSATLGGFAALTKEDINEDGDTYECEIAVYSLSGGNINSLIRSILSAETKFNDWIPSSAAWTYASVDDPTGVLTINEDLTSKIGIGTKLKFANQGNTVYGIISKAPSYSSPDTTVTFLHEIDPTDSQALHIFDNSGITNVYYSNAKSPVGFPLEPEKWSIVKKVTDIFTQANPSQNTVYNITSQSIPIGNWIVDFEVAARVTKGTAATLLERVGLSTGNNTLSDAEMIGVIVGASMTELVGMIKKSKSITLAAKATYYLNCVTSIASLASIGTLSDQAALIIRAKCGYL